MEKWLIRNKKIDLNKLSQSIGVSEFLCKLLVNRDVVDEKEMKKFLLPTIDKLYSPVQLKDMDKAIKILVEKIKNRDKIRIVGDYDVDGTISTFLLMTGLKRCGANVDYIIPDRIVDGYGININIIDDALKNGVDTIITCDNGISAIEQINYAKEKGLTVIITDHHDIPFEEENGEKRYINVKGDAVINPKQLECNYPFEKICGATVVYKLIQALYEEYNVPNEENYGLLQFVAIATVCDVVDLVDENRIIVKIGLEQINKTSNKGLIQLIKETRLEGKNITTYSLGFVIGPCINATGRLDKAYKGVELLLADSDEKICALAKELVELNKERKDMTIEGVEQTINIIEQTSIKNDKVLVVFNDEIHESIAGIIAGRIKEKYNAPTIVLTKSEKGVKGSARSIEEYDMFKELTKCKSLLTKFGGHPMAAGLSLESDNIDLLRTTLNNNTVLTDEDLIPKVYIDMAVSLKDINYDLINEISILEPFGKANPKPLFGEKNVSIMSAKILGKDNNVLRMKLLKDGIIIDAIYFGDIEDFKQEIIVNYGQEQYDKVMNGVPNIIKIDLIYYPDVNEYNGNRYLQIVMQKYRMTNR